MASTTIYENDTKFHEPGPMLYCSCDFVDRFCSQKESLSEMRRLRPLGGPRFEMIS
jgi:hypothetical protein